MKAKLTQAPDGGSYERKKDGTVKCVKPATAPASAATPPPPPQPEPENTPDPDVNADQE